MNKILDKKTEGVLSTLVVHRFKKFCGSASGCIHRPHISVSHSLQYSSAWLPSPGNHTSFVKLYTTDGSLHTDPGCSDYV